MFGKNSFKKLYCQPSSSMFQSQLQLAGSAAQASLAIQSAWPWRRNQSDWGPCCIDSRNLVSKCMGQHPNPSLDEQGQHQQQTNLLDLVKAKQISSNDFATCRSLTGDIVKICRLVQGTWFPRVSLPVRVHRGGNIGACRPIFLASTPRTAVLKTAWGLWWNH